MWFHLQVIDQGPHSLQVVEEIISIQPVEHFFRQFDTPNSPAIPQGLRHSSQHLNIKDNQGVICGDLNAAGDQRHDENQSSVQQSHSSAFRVSPEPSYKDRSSARVSQQVGQDDGSDSQFKSKPQQEATRSRSNTQEEALLWQQTISEQRAESDCIQSHSITLAEGQRPEPQAQSTAQEQEGLLPPRHPSTLMSTSPSMEEEQSFQRESTASSGRDVPPAEVPCSSEEKDLKQNISILHREDIPEDEKETEIVPLLSPEQENNRHSEKEEPLGI